MKNKKSLVALVALLVVGVVGSTFAYFTSTKTFTNIFETQNYSTSVSETFDSPENWTPGTTTEKVVNVVNNGDVPVAVRIKLTEKWVNGSTELPLTITTDGDEWSVAVINFTNSTKWELKDGYYYYNEVLAKGDSTENLFDSVTYNAKMTEELAGITCTTTTSDDGKTVTETCTSGSGYAGASYTLTVTVETIQADAATSEWGYTPAS